MIDIDKTIYGLTLLLLCTLASILAYKATHGGSRFDFGEAFIDADGKTSMARICVFVALSVSTWGFVVLVQTGKLSEWYFTAYMGAFVLNGLGSKWLDSKEA